MRCNFTIGLRRRRGRECLMAAWLAILLAAAMAHAADPSPPARYKIEQPAQPLSEALHAIARKTGSSVLFDPASVSGLTARPVAGQFSAAEAITQVLQGSGLTAEVMRDGSIVVKRQAPRAVLGSDNVGVSAALPVRPSSPEVRDGPALRLAQASTGVASDAGLQTSAAGTLSSPATARIEITGSRLRRIDAQGALPINTYTREDIDRSGQPSLERFLSTLNEASMSPGEVAFGTTSGQGSVQLRGLPVGSTLVLINGRRVQAVGSSTANIFNLNLIPLAAVERIEIVPVGSSAVYGGDALAGVVNIILKKKLDGLAVDLRLTSGQGFGDGSFSVAGGASGDRGGYVLLGSYRKATPLTASERDFFGDADYRRFGGSDARTRNCTPGTVSSASGANLPGLDAPFAGIPSTAPGKVLSSASFSPTAGQANLCGNLSNGNGSTLVYGDEQWGLHASGHYQVWEGAEGFGELTYARDKLESREAGLLLNNVLVPATNAYNPFGVPVRVTARLGTENGTEGIERSTDFTRVLMGLRGGFASQWDYEASVSTTRDTGDRQLFNNSVNSAARTAALADSQTATALNPFAAGRAASDEVLRGIWTDSMRQNDGRKDQASAFVRGPLVHLPAGPVDAIAGIEWASDRYEAVVPGTDARNSRRSSAAYGELRMPLLQGGTGGSTSWDLAALSVAARRDHYSDFGDASTYQAGLELRPARSMLLRASAATSFKPPTLLQTSVDDLSLPLGIVQLVDPARGNEPIQSGELLRATNPDLHPEKGKAYAVGAIWEPTASGTRFGLTAWRVKIKGLIALLAPQLYLDNEDVFGSLVTRAPSVGGQPGLVTRLRWSEVNFGGVETAGIDLEATHSWGGQGRALDAWCQRHAGHEVRRGDLARLTHRGATGKALLRLLGAEVEGPPGSES